MRWRSSVALALAVVTLAACAGDKPKRGGFRAVSDVPVKIGAPYRAGGRTWVPADDRGYDAVGMASWYGAAHAGRPTANGERFAPERVSAAHPTLPLPSYVEVTALDTGRTILTRINDRGPFAAGRIIDLSAGAATLLGIRRQGVARVRVRRVEPPEADRAALRAGRAARARPDTARGISAIAAGAVAPAGARRATAAASASATSTPADAVRAPGEAGELYVRVALLDDPDRADGLAASLAPADAATAAPAGSLWQVRAGPYADAATAKAALERLVRSGYQDARIVRESAAGQEAR
ncbi:MAG: septal ring lytic transglycosylase RlpA family protein [Sphingomonas sp.]